MYSSLSTVLVSVETGSVAEEGDIAAPKEEAGGAGRGADLAVSGLEVMEVGRGLLLVCVPKDAVLGLWES